MSRGFPGQGAPFFGGPNRMPIIRPEGPTVHDFLWRAATFRLVLPIAATGATNNIRVPLYPERMLIPALHIVADAANEARISIGNREVTSAIMSSDLVAGSNYFQLEAGRAAWVYVDDAEHEFIDVAQFWAVAGDGTIGTTNYLHCTAWQPQRL